MPSINQLSATATVAAGDLLALWSTANGDTRKVSLSVVAAYIQTLLTANSGFITQYSAPAATGFSVTIDPVTDGGSVRLLLTPIAGYAAGTIVLPALAECQDGQELLVSTTQAVTTLTVSGNGATVVGAPTTLAANAFFRLQFDGVLNTWYRVG
ncbi:MAG: hypothetical protein V4857_14295 [Pseudomonadota bacterium]